MVWLFKYNLFSRPFVWHFMSFVVFYDFKSGIFPELIYGHIRREYGPGCTRYFSINILWGIKYASRLKQGLFRALKLQKKTTTTTTIGLLLALFLTCPVLKYCIKLYLVRNSWGRLVANLYIWLPTFPFYFRLLFQWSWKVNALYY